MSETTVLVADDDRLVRVTVAGGLRQAGYTVVEAADDLVLLFGGPVEEMTGQVWFRVEGQDLVWAVPEYVKNNLFKTADELRAE